MLSQFIKIGRCAPAAALLLLLSANHSYGQAARAGGAAAGGARAGGAAGGGARAGGAAAGSYISPGQIGTATITSDPETGTITAIGDTETLSKLGDIIKELDKPKPQVLINVVFMQVTYNKGLDIGLEGSYSKTINSSPTTMGLTNFFGLLAGAGTLAGGGGLYSILGPNYEATLRASKTAGNVKILSRPSILARNNQVAIISVGRRIPTPGGFTVDNNGNEVAQSPVYYQTGITLRVTPYIRNDGQVQMVIAPQVSDLDTSYVANLGQGTTAPAFTSTYAETVVVTGNGQPIALGGLMQDSKSDSETRIPILGDIPVLGNLFKHKTTSDAQQELIIFMTPHVVSTPSDLPAMAKEEANKTILRPAAKNFTEKDLKDFQDDIPVQDQPPAK